MLRADWRLLQTVHAGKRPSDLWEATPDDHDLSRLYHELRLLRAAGCPADRERGNPQIEKWEKYQPPTLSRPIQIYVLKATPARWRLYFYVVPPRENRTVEIIHAVSKKQQKRNSKADLARCKFILDRIGENSAECDTFYIPDTR